MQKIQNTGLDPITINNLIQKELLTCLSLQLLHKQPSLFAVLMQTNNLHVFNKDFYTKLERYLKPNVFDNNATYKLFLKDSLCIYNESVAEIAKNIKTSYWMGTGFEDIADDIFK